MSKINKGCPVERLNHLQAVRRTAVLRALRGKILLLGVVLSLLACDHPFKAGLGPVEDVRPPTVTLVTPAAGDYIYGNQLFTGTAEDDYKLESVSIRQVNYTTYTDEEGNEQQYPLQEYVPVSLDIRVNKGDWNYTIDTREFPDGDFKIQLLVKDSVGKEAETDPIVFLINNSLPAIAVSAPYIARGTEAGEVGSSHLNYETVETLPYSLTYPRQLDKGGFLTGTISHDEDIYLGKPDAATDRYPPQIRIWKVGEGEGYAPGVIPPESEVPWEQFVINETLWALDLGSYQFIRDLPPEAGYFYGFELRAQTKDGRESFHYPRDAYPGRDWSVNGAFEKENRYVLIFVRSPMELPTINLYDLEDILGPNGWENGVYKDLPGVSDDGPHPYVNKVTVNKNGDFTLRIKTAHPEGISTAEVYWEKDDGSERGRFIWDLANVAPPGHTAVTWPPANNVGADRPYSEWGYRDPHSEADGFYQTRNFIFTYKHGGDNRVPTAGSVPGGVHEQVQGRSKIQRYTGTQEWESGKRSGMWPTVSAANAWEDITIPLSEGGYNIEFYTRSAYGTPLTVPETCSVRLDWGAPEVKIEKSLDDGILDLNLEGETVVNGVISPRMIITDSRSVDSGLRSAPTSDYNPGVYEQWYIVVKREDSGKVDALINGTKNWWPGPVKGAELTGITIEAFGPVEDSRVRFKTSPIYKGNNYPTSDANLLNEGLTLTGSSATNEARLPDGPYSLYVFARDNAFNVGKTSLNIYVNHKSDFPVFDFSVSGSVNEKVTDPNLSADLSAADNGFRYYNNGVDDENGIGVRNSLGPQTSIRFRLRDDDSLDLGTSSTDGNALSSVKISIAGSSASGTGVISEMKELSLTDAQVKNVFLPQPVDAGVRRAIREQQGEIAQFDLVELLKSDTAYASFFPAGNTYTSLPDGIYKLTITAADYAPAKLRINGTDPLAAVAGKTISFWVAVDTIAPVINVTYPVSGSFITAKGAITINGTVSDKNGPITGEIVSIKDTTGKEIGFTTPADRKINVTGSTSGGLWTGNFTPTITPAEELDGTYIFTLRFTDRFGKQSVEELRYSIDAEPAKVAQDLKIKTFEREGVKEQVAAYSTIPDADFTRLTNGIVSFSFSATDNLKVTEARWWLVPAGATDEANKPANFNAYGLSSTTANNTTVNLTGIASGKGGRTTDSFSGKIWYIDTNDTSIPNGRYMLYAAAMDEAQNATGIVTLLQGPIYVLRDEDKPWFGPGDTGDITPASTSTATAVVGASQAILRGTIYDDDGFFTDNNGTLRADSIRLYLSDTVAGTAPTAAQLEAATLSSTTGGTVTGKTYVSAGTIAGGITRVGGGSDIKLQINLKEISAFTSRLTNDGVKHYIIEARDSYFGKVTDETGTAATNTLDPQVRRKYFSFVYDSNPPVVTIIKPDAVETFGLSANSASTKPFGLQVSIADAYLDTMTTNGNYYISYKKNTDEYAVLDLGFTDTGTQSVAGITRDSVDTTTSPGIKIVTFTLTADKLTELIGYSGLDSGTHQLAIQAKDRSGNPGAASLVFNKDKDPPEVGFFTINGELLPTVPWTSDRTGTTWWNAPASTNENLRAKRTALGAMPTPLTTIQYEGTSVTIKGSFTDAFSNIDTTSFKYYLDDKLDPATDLRTGTITGSGRNVNWEITLTGVADGVHSIRIIVADVGGNTLNDGKDYGFILVSNKPTMTLNTTDKATVIGDYRTTRTGTTTVANTATVFTIAGRAASASLKNVRLGIRYTGTANNNAWGNADTGTDSGLLKPLATGYTAAELSFVASPYSEFVEWTFNVPRSALYKAGSNNTTGETVSGNNGYLKEGTYELKAVAIDWSGVESDEESWEFTIDRTIPLFEFSSPRNTTAALPANRLPADWLIDTARNVISSSEPKIQIRISDANNLKEAQYEIRRYNYNGGTNGAGAWGDYYTGTGWSATAPTVWPTITLPTAGTNGHDWVLDMTNAATWPDGYYYVRVRARDSSQLVRVSDVATDGDDTADSWTYKGTGNPATSAYGYFFLSRSLPTLSLDTAGDKFSSRLTSNQLSFDLTATDNNWFENMTVTVVSQIAGYTHSNATTPITVAGKRSNTTPATGNWKPTAVIPFPASCPDGAYRLNFTVTSLAGRQTTISRTITLDNTPPTGKFEEPRQVGLGADYLNAYPYPTHSPAIVTGDTFYGGEDATISGTTDDIGANGSASGVAGIWYHLGYVGSAAANTEGVHSLAFPTEDMLMGTVTGLNLVGGKDLGGSANNAIFDTAAGSRNNAWFKYEANAGIPNGLNALGATVDLLNWQLKTASTAAIAAFASNGFTLKTTGTGTAISYNPATGAGNWLVKLVDEEKKALLPSTIAKSGLYSMPLWVRVADGVGNVSYFCRDIWIYPNGDYPSTAIINPSANTDQTAPRGGMFSIEGVASDNVSVKTVIYRVRADNVTSSASGVTGGVYNANWATVVPAATVPFVTIPGAVGLDPATAPEFRAGNGVNGVPGYSLATSSNPFGTGANQVSTTGWYYATLEGTPAPNRPWNILINGSDEINTILNTAGRYFEYQSARYVRIYVEVFAFDGNNALADNFNKISLGTENVEATPRPFTRVLYMKDSSPAIKNTRLSTVTGFDGFTGNQPWTRPDTSFAAYSRTDNVRSRQFALKMDLDGQGSSLSSIDVRVSGVTGWQNAWASGTNNNLAGVNLTATTSTIAREKFAMTYSFDSTITAAAGANGFAPVIAASTPGYWATTGGTLTVEVRIRDTSVPQPGEAITTFEVAIDNFAPVADTARNVTATKVAGSNVEFFGRAFDYSGSPASASPPHNGISEVRAWFTRNANGTADYINMSTGALANATTAGATAAAGGSRYAWLGRSAWDTAGRQATITWTGANNDTVNTITLNNAGTRTANVLYPTATNYYKLLNETAGATTGSGVTWQPNNNNPRDIWWGFILNTANLPDGWIYLNYLVIDKAGNATRYQQRMIVMNRYPQIGSVTLYTDNTGEGAAFTTHPTEDAYTEYALENGVAKDPLYRGAGYLNSGFISKNQAIGFGVQSFSGNPPLNYRVRYVQRVSITLTRANLLLMANKTYGAATIGNVNLYTIKSLGNIDGPTWNLLGVKEADPQPGNTFVFQATPAAVNALPLEATDTPPEVWGYATPGDLAIQKLNVGAVPTDLNSAGYSTPETANVEVDPADLVMLGSNYFGTAANRIGEFTGSQPGSTDPAAPDNPATTAFFLLKVWDSVDATPSRPTGTTALVEDEQLYDTVVIGMNVFLSDGKAPTIQLYDLNPYVENAVTGYNIGNLMNGTNVDRASNPYKTRRNAANPSAIGYNVLRGGLFNTGTERELKKSGYIEPRNGSTALKPGNAAGMLVPPLQTDALGYVTAPGFGGYGDDSAARTDTNSARDLVSGSIILRGVVHDDQLIDEIDIQIGGGAWTNILKLQYVITETDGTPVLDADGNEQIVPSTSTQTKKYKMVRASNNTQAWAFEELHWKTGHTVEWAYIWNTETLANGDLTINVRTKDKNGPSGGLTSTVQTRNLRVVPYVTGFTRDSSKYTTTRSRQGWYSFYQGEGNIAVNGFNLGTTALTVNLNYGSGNSNLYTTYSAADGHRFRVGTSATSTGTTLNSGRITITAGAAVHNTAAEYTNKSWNREYSAYINGSELWINRPHAHIWRSNATTDEEPATAIYNSAGSNSPSFSLQYVTPNTNTDGAIGRLHAAYAIYGNAAFYYGHNGGNTRTTLGYASEPYMETDIDYLNITTFTNNTYSDNRLLRNVVTSYWGDSNAILKIKTIMATGVNNESTFDNTANSTGNANTPHVAWHTGTTASATNRFQNNRIRKRLVNGDTSTTTESGNAGSAYITSYDSVYNRLLFVPQTTRQTSEANIRAREVYLDGGNNTNYTTNATASTGGGVISGIINNNVAGTIAKSDRAGRWSAVDWRPSGTADNQYPVVAYYDESNDTLRLAYANNVNPTAGNNWTRRYVFPVGHALRTGSGTYVSMKIDDQGYIHLAFFNSTYNTVVYARGSTTDPATAVFTAYTVDNVVPGGTHTDISLDDNRRPWIVYSNSTRFGNYDGVRIAYLSADFTRALTDPVTGTGMGNAITGWEAVSLPSDYRVTADTTNYSNRLNIAAWPPNYQRSGLTSEPTRANNAGAGQRNSWNAAVGYGSDMFRIAYFYKPQAAVMTGW